MKTENNSIVDKASTLASSRNLGNGSQVEQWEQKSLEYRFIRGQLTSQEKEALR